MVIDLEFPDEKVAVQSEAKEHIVISGAPRVSGAPSLLIGVQPQGEPRAPRLGSGLIADDPVADDLGVEEGQVAPAEHGV